jgi:hypothetical protein
MAKKWRVFAKIERRNIKNWKMRLVIRLFILLLYFIMTGRITRRNCKKPKGVSKSRRVSKSKKSRRGSKSRKYRRGGDADSLSRAISHSYTKEQLDEKEKRMVEREKKLKLEYKIEQERRAKIRANMEIEAEKKRIDRLNNPTRGDRLKNFGKSMFGFNKPASPQ